MIRRTLARVLALAGVVVTAAILASCLAMGLLMLTLFLIVHFNLT